NDVEYILLFRKGGEYRHPTAAQRAASIIERPFFDRWFQQIWSDVAGASLKNHPAPFPTEIAYRLIRMFSFVGDTVLDPFLGTGSTMAAAVRAGRISIGNEIDPQYIKLAESKIRQEIGNPSLFGASPQFAILLE